MEHNKERTLGSREGTPDLTLGKGHCGGDETLLSPIKRMLTIVSFPPLFSKSLFTVSLKLIAYLARTLLRR